MNPLINMILVGIVSAIALETIIYWHLGTKGTWREYPAGRSLMYLLLIIGVGFGFGTFNQWLGQYPARAFVGFVLYLLFIAALIVIRITIRAEMRRGRKQKVQTVLPTHTGPMDITVASQNKEAPFD